MNFCFINSKINSKLYTTKQLPQSFKTILIFVFTLNTHFLFQMETETIIWIALGVVGVICLVIGIICIVACCYCNQESCPRSVTNLERSNAYNSRVVSKESSHSISNPRIASKDSSQASTATVVPSSSHHHHKKKSVKASQSRGILFLHSVQFFDEFIKIILRITKCLFIRSTGSWHTSATTTASSLLLSSTKPSPTSWLLQSVSNCCSNAIPR